MSLNAGKTRLVAVTKDLAIHWSQTKERWADSKSKEFEQQYLDELFASVDAAATVIGQLDQVLAKIRSDCE